MRIGTSGCLEPISDDTEWDELVSSSIEASPFLMSSFLRSIKQESSRFVHHSTFENSYLDSAEYRQQHKVAENWR